MNLTVDEQQVIAIFNAGNRMSTIAAIQEMRGDLEQDETELRELTASALDKLRTMTDAEFEALDLTIDF